MKLNSSDVGLQRRVMAYAFIGLTSLAAIYAWVALDAVDKSSEAILRERVNLASTVAQSIDLSIVSGESLVALTARDLSSVREIPGILSTHEIAMLESLRTALADVNAGAAPENLFLFGSNGDLIWEAPRVPGESSISLDSATFENTESGSILTDRDGNPVISVGAGISGDVGLAYLGAVILPSDELFSLSNQNNADFGEYRIELVDSLGKVIANSSGERPNVPSRHLDVIDELVESQIGGVAEHAPASGEDANVDHIVAYASLTSVPWGVVLEQREDAALALPNKLRQRVLLIAAFGLIVGLAMAWITSRQVVRPLARLTGRAKRIADGDLSGTIAAEGQDEVRRLAESFETMRDRLEVSQRELSDWSAELENRVRDRTDQLLQRDQERDVLLSKVISAQEDERKRIARDLHDQIGQTLTGLVMQIGGAEAALTDDQVVVKQQLVDLGESASDAVEEVRRMMSDLRPSILDDMGLESAVSWYAESHLKREGVIVDLDLEKANMALPPNIEISAFRVFQEAMANVIKHADASRVRISLHYDGNRVIGSIGDDGRGFDVSAERPNTDGGWSVGLLGMSERVGLLGGSLQLESSLGEGTTLKFEIPLESVTHGE